MDANRPAGSTPAGARPKRRLPLIASNSTQEMEAPRASWQWVGFGVLAIFSVWLPLAAAAGLIASSVRGSSPPEGRVAATSAVAFVTASVGALALAGVAGGYLLGRWGGPSVGLREAAWAGLSASLVAIVGSGWAFGFSSGSLIVTMVAVPSACAGAALGLRARRPLAL